MPDAITRHLDVTGTFCPLPILLAAREMLRLTVGDLLEVVGDDPGILEDMPVWCERAGHRLVAIAEREGRIVSLVEKGGRERGRGEQGGKGAGDEKRRTGPEVRKRRERRKGPAVRQGGEDGGYPGAAGGSAGGAAASSASASTRASSSPSVL